MPPSPSHLIIFCLKYQHFFLCFYLYICSLPVQLENESLPGGSLLLFLMTSSAFDISVIIYLNTRHCPTVQSSRTQKKTGMFPYKRGSCKIAKVYYNFTKNALHGSTTSRRNRTITIAISSLLIVEESLIEITTDQKPGSQGNLAASSNTLLLYGIKQAEYIGTCNGKIYFWPF